jgi:hypothetical protein
MFYFNIHYSNIATAELPAETTCREIERKLPNFY